MASKAKMAEFIALLSENFKGAPSASLTRIIGEKLKNFSDGQLAQGLERLLCTRVYSGFPALAEILEAIQGERDELTLEGLIQFDKALNMAHDVYGNALPAKLAEMNPVGRQVLRLMGNASKFWKPGEYDFKRRDFVAMYVQLARNPQKLLELGGALPPPSLFREKLKIFHD